MRQLFRTPHLRVWGTWRTRVRRTGVLLVALMAMLSATVAFGQASLNFDIACRTVMSGGGGTILGGDFGVTAALGVPIAPVAESTTFPTYAARSTNFGLRAGFLPGYPTDIQVTASAAVPEQRDFVSRMPIVHRFLRIVREGC